MKFLLLHATIVASLATAGNGILGLSTREANHGSHSDKVLPRAIARHSSSRILPLDWSQETSTILRRSDPYLSIPHDQANGLDVGIELQKRGQCMGKLPCTGKFKSKSTQQAPNPTNENMSGSSISNAASVSSFGTLFESSSQSPQPSPPRSLTRTPSLTPPRRSLLSTDNRQGAQFSPAWNPRTPPVSNTASPSVGAPYSSVPSPSIMRTSPISRNPSFYRTFAGRWSESPETASDRIHQTMPSPARNNALSSFSASNGGSSGSSIAMEDYRALQSYRDIGQSPSVAMQRAHATLSRHYAIVADRTPTTLDELARQTRWMEKQNSHSLTAEYFSQQARSRRSSFAGR